jgi:hypothetical protein
VFDIASSVWSFGLPMIQRIINRTVHSGIGIAPAQLGFALHADLDRGILFDWAPPVEQAAANPPARTNAFVAELFHMQVQVLETALAVQLAQDAQHLADRQASQIADPVEIREGDYVLLEYPDLGLGALVSKIRTPRKGPFEVTQRVNANRYRIRDSVCSFRIIYIHFSRHL